MDYLRHLKLPAYAGELTLKKKLLELENTPNQQGTK